MSWAPSGLSEPLLNLVRAIDRQFAPLRPSRPVRLPGVVSGDLTAISAARDPLGTAINLTTNKQVQSVPDGVGGYVWVHADGSAAP